MNNTNDTLIACLASHLRYLPPENFEPLRERLAAGVPFRSALDELDAGPLRERWLQMPDVAITAEKTAEWCRHHDVDILHPWHPQYPERLMRSHRPPVFLSVWGTPVWHGREGLGIVGSREPTKDAIEWLETQLPSALHATGVFTASGGARGVDQLAHALSLRAGAPTVAFLPSGLAQVYPKDFSGWVNKIRDAGGAVVSEFPPKTEMAKHHFERRNRMIATLGCGLFVVEAARKSGSIMTARLALEAGRSICVLPSTPLEPRAAGTLDLLFDGASLIRNDVDLVGFVALNSRLVAD